MTEQSKIDCFHLSSITTFPAYVTKIRNVTSNDFSLVPQCKPEVCNALWGSGNSDISGIGMIIGYIVENVLGVVLALTLALLRHQSNRLAASPTSSIHRYLKIAIRVGRCYQDFATFFALSTQIACLVILSEYNFDISVTEIGYSTANIAEAVSSLTLLPLMYITFQPSLLKDYPATGSKNDDHEQALRFFWFVVCWVLSIYPFASRMYHAFGPRSGELSIIESNQIKDLCFTDVDGSARGEVVAMRFFAVAGYAFVSLLTIIKISWPMVNGLFNLPQLAQRYPYLTQSLGRKFLFGILPLIATSQIWTILRIRGIQKEISISAGNEDADGKWGFGQIAAVTVFFPMLSQLVYGIIYRRILT